MSLTSQPIAHRLESPPHAMSAAEVLAGLSTDRTLGLSAAEAQRRLQADGPNQLAEAPPTPAWKRLAAQFQTLVIWILIFAAIIAGALGEWADTLAILAIVALNGLIGFLQEQKAERALAALKKLSAPVARVFRDGQLAPVPGSELVAGDLVDLEAGDSVPADARLVEAFGLSTQEASLTGESTPVEKDALARLDGATPLGDRRNMAYMGSLVTAGKAKAIVVATGMRTELGGIASLLQSEPPQPTPLQRRLHELGRVLVALCLAVVAVIFVVQLARGGKLAEVLLLSVSLAVAAVPEGLPAVVTLALAIGLQRMVARNALVRKLPSVETLGSVTVICSDKTGTLTRNEMTVRALVTADGGYRVHGAGYAPQGRLVPLDFDPAASDAPWEAALSYAAPPDDGRRDGAPEAVRRAAEAAVRCNHSRLDLTAEGAWRVVGDPTEGALVVLARKAGVEPGGPPREVLHEIPFDSQRKAMSIVVRDESGQPVMYTKGAPEVVLERATHELTAAGRRPLTQERRAELARINAALAGCALRVIALAERRFDGAAPAVADYEERELTFLALAGMIDPPRDEARSAVETCRLAGIQPVMITGDHPATALAIARDLGIATAGDAAVTGPALDALDDRALEQRVPHIPVLARVSAEHKMRIVKAWQARGQVVAMTGDGVNDAPAVKAADIGIAMGVTGSDVTKEASDMVLTDDNFASIVSAVEEGRGIFDNIQKFIHYLLSCNAAEIMVMFVAATAGWPLPLTAVQILWLNLVTDGLPALALALEPPERDAMRRRPRPPREPVITLRRGLLMALHGLLMASVTLVGFYLSLENDPANVGRARTVAFCTLAYAQLTYSFACRSLRYTLPELGPFTNPYLLAAIAGSAILQFLAVSVPWTQPWLEVQDHSHDDWLRIGLLSLAPVTIIELYKLAKAAALRKASAWG